MYILMHEILHFYLGNSPGPASNMASEVNEINEAVGLGAGEAISNAQNYVFYAASKSNSGISRRLCLKKLLRGPCSGC